jgi:hypothetical protein
MADLQLSEHTRLSGGRDFAALTDQASMYVWLWDLGPLKPVVPVKPKAPLTKDGTPDHDLAMIDFRQAIADYEADLVVYKKANEEYIRFQRVNGGPIELMRYSVDADDILMRDPKRYCISSRTRGHSALKNRGLPPGVRSGHGQAAQELRERQGEADLQVLRRSDPIFGQIEDPT